MSLKAVHLVFVTCLSTMMLGCGVWLLRDHFAAPDDRAKLVLGCLACATGVTVIVYGRYFLKKLKNVSYL